MAETEDPQPSPLPYGRQSIDEDDIAAVRQVLAGDWLTTGPAIEAFEAALCQATGAAHAIACSSGTAALHLTVRALDLGPGDAAVVPAITFAATANAVRLEGAEVVFADVDPATGLIGPGELEAALSRLPEGLTARAVLPVHLNGQTVALPDLAALAAAAGLALISDASHAIGGAYGDGNGDWCAVGAGIHERAACFSFHPVKTVTMGEGGAVTSNDGPLAARLRRLRQHGIVRGPEMIAADPGEPWQYEIAEVGLNYRASDLHCALGLSQLGKLKRFVARRADLVARYDLRLAPLAPVLRPLARAAYCRPAWHLYVIRLDWPRSGTDRAALMAALRARGIASQVHYIPLHQQPYYLERYGRLALPGAEAYYAQCLSLPLYPAMADSDVDRVVDALTELIPGGA